jgi:hypothetical protein
MSDAAPVTLAPLLPPTLPPTARANTLHCDGLQVILVTRGEGGAEGTWRLIGRRAQGQASAPCLHSLHSSSTLRYVVVCRKLSSARLRVFRTAKVKAAASLTIDAGCNCCDWRQSKSKAFARHRRRQLHRGARPAKDVIPYATTGTRRRMALGDIKLL